ncbi:MAG: hypothetical protein KIS86_05155 [Devosia sp.]|nr:hypothetical protein [Devosia sp.]
MAMFGRAERIDWTMLKMQEQLVMLAMTGEPQLQVEWPLQRALCFHKLAEITPRGLRLTRLGRLVMAERHGLPVVVGRDGGSPPLASMGR